MRPLDYLMRLSDHRRVLGTVAVLAVVVVETGTVQLGVQTLNDAIANIVTLIIGGIGGLAIPLILWPERFGRKLDEELIVEVLKPSLSHLTIHYSGPDDTSETKRPKIPYYVVNSRTMQAYWVSNAVRELSRRGPIEWVHHDGEAELLKHFTDTNIRPHKRFPFDDKKELA